MLKKTNIRYFLLFTIAILFFVGCAGPGKYVLTNQPTHDIKAFRNVEVVEVEVGVTKDELDPETTIELRTAIIKQIEKKGIYSKIAAELEATEGVLEIQSKIIEFDKGSRGGRWLLGGLGLGKATLDVYCKFINKRTGDTIAEGTFLGEIKGGWYGGSANQKTLSKNVAQGVAKFLKKGK